MGKLFDLTIERHVVFILLKHDLSQYAGIGDTFGDGKSVSGSDNHSLSALHWLGGVELSVLLSFFKDTVEFAQLKAQAIDLLISHQTVACHINGCLRLEDTCL